MSDGLVSSNALQNGDNSIKVRLADDSEIMRRGNRQLLAAHSEIEVVGESVNFAQTVQLTNGPLRCQDQLKMMS
jgi:hypothetical protein